MPIRTRERPTRVVLTLIILFLACSALFATLEYAKASGSYDNASIADKALNYVGKSGTVACSGAGKTGGAGWV